LNDSGTALAQGTALPKRLVVFFWGNGRGIDANRWTPEAAGPGWALSPQLAPLTNVKEYLNIVSGFDVKLTNSPRDHHKGVVGMLSGADFISQPPGSANFRSTLAVPTIDQVAARELGKTTAFGSVELGVTSRVARGEGTTLMAVSHRGPDAANLAEISPLKVFTRIFANVPASGTPTGPAVDPLIQATLEMRKSVLDAVIGDLGTLKARVGARDRTRLDQHTDGIREIEKRLMTTTTPPPPVMGCSKPAAPTDPTGTSEPLEARMQLMSSLLAKAFICDVTRVGTMLMIGSVGSTVVPGTSQGHHEMSHGGSSTQSGMDTATIFVMKQLGILLETFKNTVDGTGNLLDSSVVLATSDTSNGATHSSRDMPIIVAGRARGALKYPGIHVKGATDNNTSRVLLSLLRSVGLNLTEFGAGGGRTTSPLSDIQA
jgi:hypothetical protein